VITSSNPPEVEDRRSMGLVLGTARYVCAFIAILIAHAALADLSAPEIDRSPASDAAAPGSLRMAEPGWLPGSLSVVPGAALHGAGVYMAGDRKTARRLLIAEGPGLCMMVAGGLPLMLTHALGPEPRRDGQPPAAGSGVFLTS
jgi:hypothetical protein